VLAALNTYPPHIYIESKKLQPLSDTPSPLITQYASAIEGHKTFFLEIRAKAAPQLFPKSLPLPSMPLKINSHPNNNQQATALSPKTQI
jgi:hypothetical protein